MLVVVSLLIVIGFMLTASVSFYLSRHYEVCKYFSLDEHTSVPDLLLISTVVWNDLTAQEQKWIQEAADESYVFQKELWKESTLEALKAVEAAGVKISYPKKDLFIEITALKFQLEKLTLQRDKLKTENETLKLELEYIDNDILSEVRSLPREEFILFRDNKWLPHKKMLESKVTYQSMNQNRTQLTL